jgi:hypothetical protein
MTPEEQKFFNDAREMFISAGWKNFIADVTRNIENTRVENLEDEKAFWIAKGQLAVLHQIAGYENLIYHSEAEAEQDDES